MRYLLSAALALACVATSAQAGFIDTVTVGVQNTYQDVSREQVYYQNGAKGLQVGDVIVGFNSIDLNATPGGPHLTQNTLYTAFSVQVMSITNGGTTVNFAPTAVGNAHSLQTILGMPGLNSGTMFMLLDRLNASPFGVNLLNTNPPPGATATMNDYIKYLAANGTLELTGGFKTGNPDFFSTDFRRIGGVQITASSATAAKVNSFGNGLTFGDNNGGLSILDNNTGLGFIASNVGEDLMLHQLTIQQASVSGGNNLANFKNWGGPGANNAGVSDNASFSLTPFVVPEPSSIALFSIAIIGLGVGGYFGKKRRCGVA